MGLMLVLFRFALVGLTLSVVLGDKTINRFGALAGLTRAMRLRFCSKLSAFYCGALAALVVVISLYYSGVLHYLLPSRGDSTIWTVPQKMYIAISVLVVLGAVFGLLRRRTRRRWPQTLLAPIAIGKTKVNEGAGGLYVDELLLPILFFPAVFSLLMYLEPEYRLWLLGDLFLAVFIFPVFLVLMVPFYALWAWIQSGFLGLFGRIAKQETMKAAAYDVLLRDDQVQRWLGEINIIIDHANNRYVVSGMLPQRSILATLRSRLEGISGAQVDTSAVTVDPTMQPNYRRLTALSRQGTFATRRNALTK